MAPVVFVLKGYPRLSETFIAHEIRELERRGLDIRIVSLRHPTDRVRHPVHGEIAAPVLYLPEYLWREPFRVLRGWRRVRRLAGYRAARRAWLRDWRRDPSPNRARRFGQALVLAAELPEGVGALHAHFLHTPASVARYAALMHGLPWTVSAHAKDIWTTAEWEKREKLAECAWLVTCTAAGRDHLAALAVDPGKVELCYHGLDLARFPPVMRTQLRDGADPADPVRLLSVGRAVAKKGYDDLLDALALLPPALAWRLVHIGGGALASALAQRATRLGLADRIEWRSAQPQAAVLGALREADFFVLASRIAADGDRDGLPNVLVEAQSQGLPCLSTAISAIPELIEHDRTGLLVAPQDPPALAAALAALIRNPALRRRLGAAGEERVRASFSIATAIDRLHARFLGPATVRDAAD
jgi:glycosyltransferase involved in cell wall biosynthesis